MTGFVVGDRVWWKHTESYIRRGIITELDTNTTVGVRLDDSGDIIYLDARQLNRAIPAEDGIYSGISDIDYHADTSSLSSSGARALLAPSCPAIFDYERRKPPDPKPQYDFGAAAHRYVLGEGRQIVEVKAEDWRGQAALKQRRCAWDEGKVPLLSKDVTKAKDMAKVVRAHPVAHRLLDAEGQAELSGYWTDTESGVRLRFRPDWLCQIGGRIICVDYKSARSAHPGAFARAAADHGYHQQHAWYADGLSELGIADDAPFLFIVQDKTPPYPVSVLQIHHKDIDLGRRRNREAIDLYHRCTTEQRWPGYSDVIEIIELPSFIVYQQEQELAI